MKKDEREWKGKVLTIGLFGVLLVVNVDEQRGPYTLALGTFLLVLILLVTEGKYYPVCCVNLKLKAPPNVIGTISAGGDGSKLENAKWGVGLAPSGGVFRDDLSHGLPYLQLLTV
uniref:Uncharacterized protein n=1 Tax=Tanacetum cinerariifolium TaxID=118510 RepID=A0A699HSX1_TANCI|nr:hypothetical protein [Tanacetum cinerariifolium]